MVLLTALSGRDERIQGIEAGADDFISKPFDKGGDPGADPDAPESQSAEPKVKGAYQNILGLVAVGGELIRAFDPLTFSLQKSVDAFAAQLIRGAQADTEKPRIALVGLPTQEGYWSWRQYSDSERVSPRLATAVIPTEVVRASDSHLVFSTHETFWSPPRVGYP